MDLENIIPDSTNGSLETRVKKQVFQSELKLLRGGGRSWNVPEDMGWGVEYTGSGVPCFSVA